MGPQRVVACDKAEALFPKYLLISYESTTVVVNTEKWRVSPSTGSGGVIFQPMSSSQDGIPDRSIALWKNGEIAHADFTVWQLNQDGSVKCAASARFNGKYKR
jgi:hypothetical protein